MLTLNILVCMARREDKAESRLLLESCLNFPQSDGSISPVKSHFVIAAGVNHC